MLIAIQKHSMNSFIANSSRLRALAMIFGSQLYDRLSSAGVTRLLCVMDIAELYNNR